MANNRKKVVILIVEGESDEVLFIDRLRDLFKEHEIRFEPQHGDILYDAKRQGKAIKEIIGETVKEILIKRKFKPNDILAIIHIIDTDGCLISEEKVIIDKEQQAMTFYQNACISVPNERQRDNILTRNKNRSRNIGIMNSVNDIVSKKYNYQMFYFSRNLEHVIFNVPNPNSESKVDNIESFLEILSLPLENFLAQFMPALTKESYENRYLESWEVISQGCKSLERSTNVQLMFDYIASKTLV